MPIESTNGEIVDKPHPTADTRFYFSFGTFSMCIWTEFNPYVYLILCVQLSLISFQHTVPQISPHGPFSVQANGMCCNTEYWLHSCGQLPHRYFKKPLYQAAFQRFITPSPHLAWHSGYWRTSVGPSLFCKYSFSSTQNFKRKGQNLLYMCCRYLVTSCPLF